MTRGARSGTSSRPSAAQATRSFRAAGDAAREAAVQSATPPADGGGSPGSLFGALGSPSFGREGRGAGASSDDRGRLPGVLQGLQRFALGDGALAPRDDGEPRVLGLPAAYFHLALGLLLAQVFTLGSASWFAWFSSSLVHEMGHCAASLLTGALAFPVIRLDGHAMAVEGTPSLLLGASVWGGLLALGWRLRATPVYALPLAGLVLLGATTTLIAGREAFVLIMGHGGELIFGGLCFVRCLTGMPNGRAEIECVLYSVAGWYLVLSNAALFFGLATSRSAVADYYGSGSFGLANDFERLSHEVLGVPIEGLGLAMVVACLVVLPLAFLAVRWRGGE